MDSDGSAAGAQDARPRQRQRTRSAERRAREQNRAAREGRPGRGSPSMFTPDALGESMATATANVAQSLREAMGTWPTTAAKGQAAPSQAPPGAKGASASYAAAPAGPTPFSPEQSAWLRSAVADTMGVALERFGGHLDAELTTLRDGVAAARF